MRTRVAVLSCFVVACGADDGRADDTGASVSVSASIGEVSTMSAGTTGDGTSGATTSSSSSTGESSLDGDTTSSIKFDLPATTGGTEGDGTYPVRMIPGLTAITFYERSGGDAPTPYTFTVDGPELTTMLADPLSDASRDIKGVDTEFYDVYYSDQDGVFELDGRYLTISGAFQYALPAGGGLNLAEIGLEYEGLPTEFGNYVASYVALGDNAAPETVDFTIDGDLQTNTTMGNTIGATERLRVTLGFESSSGPPG
ncbi:MAG TPA: hypothetical protein VG755_38625 [Nannocystaceae bacterium]|nr:hypothetical protein [Nannocystaceae bacterium]